MSYDVQTLQAIWSQGTKAMWQFVGLNHLGPKALELFQGDIGAGELLEDKGYILFSVNLDIV